MGIPGTPQLDEYKWKPGQSGNPNGRPAKRLTVVNKQLIAEGNEPIKSITLKEGYEVLLSLKQERLEEIVIDEEMPMILRIIAKEILGGQGFDIIEKMLDRAHGRAMFQLPPEDPIDDNFNIEIEVFEDKPEQKQLPQ